MPQSKTQTKSVSSQNPSLEELENRKKELQIQIQKLKAADPFSDPDHADDNAAVDTDIREQEDHDTIEAQVKEHEEELQDLEAAILRVKKGTYGRCIKCGKPIPPARLKLVPEAETCNTCG